MRKGLGAATAGALVVAGVLALTRHKSAGAPSAALAHEANVGCRFEAKERLAYALSSRVLSKEGDDGTSARKETGTLALAPLRPDGAGWIVAGMFVPDAANEKTDDALGRMPFLVKMGDTCRFEGFAYQPEASADDARRLEGLLRSFETIFPTRGERVSTEWSALQRDENGPFKAAYRLREGALGESATIVREVTGYLPGQSTHVKLEASDAEIRIVHGRSFVDGFVADTKQSVAFLGRQLSVDAHYTLQSIPFSEDLFARTEWDKFAWGAPRHEKETASAPAVDLAQVSAGIAYAEGLRLFELEPSELTHEKSFRYLVDWLKSHPGAASELLALVRAGQTDRRITPFVFLAIRQANTKEGRAALSSAMKDRGFTPLERERAAIALGGSTAPTLDGAQALADAVRNENGQLRDVALRSLGRLAGPEAPADVKRLAQDVIDEKLGARESDAKRAALDAAGNARDPNLLGRVAPHLDDSDPSLRASAAAALRGMGRPQGQPLLVSHLGPETDPAVQLALVQSLQENAQGQYSVEAVEALGARLMSGPAENVRLACVTALGEATRTRPEAVTALIAWLPHETRAELVQLISRFVPMDAMRAALNRKP